MVEEALQQVAPIPEVPVEACLRNAQIARESLHANALHAFRLEDVERPVQPFGSGDSLLSWRFPHGSFLVDASV
jgi:hypothetical protein